MSAIRTAARPLFVQLKETILNKIVRGRLRQGDQLPSHRELRETDQMSHMTVRRAITELTNEGGLSAVPGKGIYVAEPKQDADSGALINGSMYATLANRYGLRPASAKRTAEAVLADREQADFLGLPLPSAQVLIEQLTFLDSGAAVEYSRILYRGDRYRVPVR